MKKTTRPEASSVRSKSPQGKTASVKSKRGTGARKTTTETKRKTQKEEAKKPAPPKERKVLVPEDVLVFEDVVPRVLTPLEARCWAFAEEWVKVRNHTKAARAIGVPGATASAVGCRYFKHPFTQKLLRSWMTDLEKDRQVLMRGIFDQLLEEADVTQRFQEMGSHGARIKALDTAAGILERMDKLAGDAAKKTGRGVPGVIAMPMTQTRDEWKAQVKARQAELKGNAKNPTPEFDVL